MLSVPLPLAFRPTESRPPVMLSAPPVETVRVPAAPLPTRTPLVAFHLAPVPSISIEPSPRPPPPMVLMPANVFRTPAPLTCNSDPPPSVKPRAAASGVLMVIVPRSPVTPMKTLDAAEGAPAGFHFAASFQLPSPPSQDCASASPANDSATMNAHSAVEPRSMWRRRDSIVW